MKSEDTYIHYLKNNQPEIWQSILHAAKEGLIFVDEKNDSITAAARLLINYPDLHNVLNMLTEQWIQEKTKRMRNPLISLLNDKENSND